MYSFFATPATLAPFFLRLALATIFVFHGGQKAFGWFGGDGWHATIAAWGAASGPGLPAAVTTAFIAAELAIPVLLVPGFLTRLGGLAVIILMAGELFFVSGGTTFDAVQLPLMILSAGLALLFVGGGHLSIDRSLSRNLLPWVG